MLVVLGIALWSRRGQHLPDPPGRRTACSFSGGDRYLSAFEQADTDREHILQYGEGMIEALRTALRSSLVRPEEPDGDDIGWGMIAKIGRAGAYIRVWRVPNDPDLWILLVVDPSSGGPGPAAILPLINGALRSLPGISDVRWQRREHLSIHGLPAESFESPLDPA